MADAAVCLNICSKHQGERAKENTCTLPLQDLQELIILPQHGKLRTIVILLNNTSIIQKDACILIAALFTIAKTWKQPKCPLTGMDKEHVVHIHSEV